MRLATLRKSLCALLFAGVAGCHDGGDRAKAPPAPIPPTSAVAPVTAPVTEKPIAPPPVAVVEPPGPEIPGTFEERMKRGQTLVKEGRIEGALVLFQAATELRPKSSLPSVEMARALLGISDVKHARPHAEQAVELTPTSSSAWNTLGRVEFLDGDLEAAEASFERAVQENEDNSFAWNNLGLVRSRLEHWDEAVEALERATSADRVEAFMWNNLGIAYEHGDRMIEARAAYEQAAKRHHEGAKQNLARLDAGQSDTAGLDSEDDEEITE